MVKSNALSRMALYASFFAFAVIALGAFTRLIDAGLGCPDWPGCYGHLAAPLSNLPNSHIVIYKAWAEMIHRYFVAGLSVFILTIVGTIVSQRKYRTRANSVLAAILVCALVYQILLGQWTVTLRLLPVIVTQHLFGGFIILTALWLIHLVNNKSLEKRLKPLPIGYLLPATLLALVILLVQIFLGAWTSTNYASLSCSDFPLCINNQPMDWHFKAAYTLLAPVGINYEGGVLSDSIRQTIHMTHRFGALVFTLYIIGLTFYAMPKIKQSLELIKSFYVILGLLCIQLCIGITNVIFKLPLATAVAHTLFAVLLLLALVTLVFKLVITKGRTG